MNEYIVVYTHEEATVVRANTRAEAEERAVRVLSSHKGDGKGHRNVVIKEVHLT